MVIKIAAHKLRVIDRHTEAEALHLVNVRHIFQQCRHHMVGAAVGNRPAERIDMLQLALLVATGRPFERIQIHRIGNAKILERAQELSINGFRQTDLSGDTIAEVGQDVLAVHTLRSSGQAQQDARLVVGQELLVSRRGGMVEFVHDDVIIKIGTRLFREALRVEGLDGQKQVVDALRLIVAHKQLTKVCVLEHSAEGVQALLEDFLPVRHKEQAAGPIRILLAKALVVQCRDDRLAGTGGRHHQIARIATNSALCLQLVQNLLLVGIGVDVHGVDVSIVGVEIFFRLQCPCQALFLILRVVFKFAVIPVILKGSCDLVDGFG